DVASGEISRFGSLPITRESYPAGAEISHAARTRLMLHDTGWGIAFSEGPSDTTGGFWMPQLRLVHEEVLPARLEGVPTWMKPTLLIAAAHNVAWGGLVLLFPAAMFSILGIQPPDYPVLWQQAGLTAALLGVGYAIAASDPLRYWPTILVGLL